MTVTINQAPVSTSDTLYIDFGWYGQGANRGEINQYSINGATYPQASTVTTALVTLPTDTSTRFNIQAQDTSSFIGGAGTNIAGTPYTSNTNPNGILQLYSGTSQATISYQYIFGNTFVNCLALSSQGETFGAGTAIFDPRYVSFAVPLSLSVETVVYFDAVDSLGLGLPSTEIGARNQIVQWEWDFGNGRSGNGPTASTFYWYTGATRDSSGVLSAPTQVEVTLMAVDIYRQIHYITHPIPFSNAYASVTAGSTNLIID